MLHAITDGIWAREEDLRVQARMLLSSRSTVVRLRGGGLLVHSPLPFDDEAIERIEALGRVELLVAPSCLHYMFLERAMKRWPKARPFGAPGLERKMPGVRFEPLPREGALPDTGGEVLVRRVEGVPKIGEHVLLHAPSRTLVVTDLVLNVHACRGFWTPLLLRLAGAYRKTAHSIEWRLFTRDRAQAAASVADVLAWDFDRVVVAHGDILESGGKAVLAGALAWHLRQGPPPLLGAGPRAR